MRGVYFDKWCRGMGVVHGRVSSQACAVDVLIDDGCVSPPHVYLPRVK